MKKLIIIVLLFIPTLCYAGGRMEFQNPSVASSSIGDLEDVTISSATDKQLLQYNGSVWVNITDLDYGAGTITTTDIGSFGSVAIPTVFTAMTEPTGFVDKTATLSFTPGGAGAGGTFAITGAHDIYIHGVKTTKGTTSIVTPDATALYWIYYDSSGTIQYSATVPSFTSNVFIATVYWNTTTDAYLLGEERHGIKMDVDTHALLHFTVGTRYESGLVGTFADATFDTTLGVITDEDINISIGAKTTCNVLYKNGTANFEWLEAQTKYYYKPTTTIYYNLVNALTVVPSNQYVAYWIFATNDITNPIVSLMGQRIDTTIASARANNKYESLELGTLPFQEMKLLYRVILRNDANPYEETQDLRSVSNLPAGTYVATAHNVLTGLTTGDDHTQYWLEGVSGRTANYETTGTLGAGATTVTSLDAGAGLIQTTGDITSDGHISVLYEGRNRVVLQDGTSTGGGYIDVYDDVAGASVLTAKIRGYAFSGVQAYFTAGHVQLLADDIKLQFGAAADASIYWDASDLIINSENVTDTDEVHFVGFDKVTADEFYATTFNDGIASLSGGFLSSATLGNALDAGTYDIMNGGTFTAGTLTDGTLSTTAGVVTGIASLDGAGTIDLEDNLDGTGFDITAANLIVTGNVDGVDISAWIDQDVSSGSTPTFTATNITGVPAASILAGTFGTGAYVFDNTVSGITTLTATTFTDSTLSLVGGEILDATTLEATTTLGIEIGDVQQLVLTDGKLNPTTDNDIDLGDATHQFKSLWLEGASLHLGTTHLTETRYKNTETNTSLNAFRIAINGSLAYFNMVDGIVDEYEDETGIDTAGSTNEVYDSSGDYYHPAGVGSWDISDQIRHFKLNDDAATTVIIDDSLNTTNAVLQGGANTADNTVAGQVNAAQAFDGAADYIQVPDHADFAWTTEITWSIWFKVDTGNGGALVMKDSVGSREFYSWMNTTGTVTAFIWTSGGFSNIGTTNTFNDNAWHLLVISWKSTEGIKIYVDNTHQVTGPVKTGNITLTAVDINIARRSDGAQLLTGSLDEFRIWDRQITSDERTALWNAGSGTDEDSSAGSTGNITLISNSVTAEAEPTTARVVILEEDVDAVTINTDLLAYASRDGGSTWDTITLADEGDFSSGVRILTGEVTLTSTGTSMEYKIGSANTKDLKIHGTALTWD